MTDQLPLQGPLKIICPCGCGVFGTPKRKAWGDGLHHVKGCGPCKRCSGSRAKKNAYVRERKIAKAISGERDAMSGALSGRDVHMGLWSIEETAEEALVRGLRRWWTSKQIRTKVARLMARHGEAHGFVASWDGRPQIVVVPYDDWVGQVRQEPASKAGAIEAAGNGRLGVGGSNDETTEDGRLRTRPPGRGSGARAANADADGVGSQARRQRGPGAGDAP